MANWRDIQKRIGSVKNTKKITYAMKLVSAAKLRKAQDAVASGQVYSSALLALLRELLEALDTADFSDPLITVREEVKRIGVLVVGASRGLCGSYNSNVNKELERFLKEQEENGVEVELTILGRKPAEHCRRKEIEYAQSFEELPDDPSEWPLDDITYELEKKFVKGEIDQVNVIYTKFKSALSMKAQSIQLLPMDANELLEGEAEESEVVPGVTLFEPSVADVFSAVLPRILQTRVQQTCFDAKAGEHGSRMTAMDNATSNASDLIHTLTLKCNKLRQASVTSEILDIVGGAEALASK